MKSALVDSRFKQVWVQIHSSFWFVPAFVIAGLMLLALGLVELDRHIGEVLRQQWPRLFTMKAEGARSLLSSIAGAMATIAGVTFSITMVALTLASAQYSSRVLRNFMRDKVNQTVLGIFMGIFLYCLLVLQAVSEPPEAFVPVGAVLGSVLLSVVGGGAFIFFIHHISTTIQAAEMAQAITCETLHVIDKYFPDEADEGRERAPQPDPKVAVWHPVPARQWGTIQTVAERQLLAWASAHDAIVRMEHKPGDFVGKDETLVSVAMAQAPDAAAIAALNAAYGMDAFRTLDQDPAFGIRERARQYRGAAAFTGHDRQDGQGVRRTCRAPGAAASGRGRGQHRAAQCEIAGCEGTARRKAGRTQGDVRARYAGASSREARLSGGALPAGTPDGAVVFPARPCRRGQGQQVRAGLAGSQYGRLRFNDATGLLYCRYDFHKNNSHQGQCNA